MEKSNAADTKSDLVEKSFTATNTRDESPDRSSRIVSRTSNGSFRSRSTSPWTSLLGTGLSNLESGWSPFCRFGTRQKTVSESSDASSTGADPPESSILPSTVPSDSIDIIQTSQHNKNKGHDTSPNRQENFSFGNSSQVVYDIDGKFPFSYYESKPTFYDIDGIHRYKHYRAYKPTPYTDCAPHHEKRPWIYDPAEGMIMCFTAKDIQGEACRKKT